MNEYDASQKIEEADRHEPILCVEKLHVHVKKVFTTMDELARLDMVLVAIREILLLLLNYCLCIGYTQ